MGKLTPQQYADAQKDFSLWLKTNEAIESEYENTMFCPKCGRLLTGLHMQSSCFRNYIAEKAARQILKKKVSV